MAGGDEAEVERQGDACNGVWGRGETEAGDCAVGGSVAVGLWSAEAVCEG